MTDQAFRERFHYDSEKDLIGSGGFGSVYRAYDNTEKRYVALKISQVKDIYGKFTLLNEVELSKKIDDHTNVARYEFGFRFKHPFPVDYAVMAYYEEGNLDMVLRKRFGHLTEKEYYEIVEGLLKGIGHLHNENIIHRDLKLANILMLRTKQGQWRPKIADFGLSRQIEDTDASIANSAIGITIAYAAPEQIEGGQIRKNVDLWALGVIVYRLLTGEMPFAGTQNTDPTNANLEMSRKITQVELPEKLSTVPEPYQTIIRRCFVKDTKDRPQSASELLDILKIFKPDSNSWTDSNLKTNSGRTIPQPSISFDEPIAGTEIAPPSVPKPIYVPKTVEIVEESTQVEMPPLSNSFGTLANERETLIEPSFTPKHIVSESETLIEPSSVPKHIVSENETLIEPISKSKPIVDENKTLIEPTSKPKKTVEKKNKFITPPSVSKPVVDENKTLIDPLQGEKPVIEKPVANKRKMLIWAAIIAAILCLGFCKMCKPGDGTGGAVPPAEPVATTLPPNITTEGATTGSAIPANSTISGISQTNQQPKNTTQTPNTGQAATQVITTSPSVQGGTVVVPSPPAVTVNTPSSPSQEDIRRAAAAAEAERNRLAAIENANKAAEAERIRKATEERNRLAAEAEAERLRREEEAKKTAPPPAFVSAKVDLFSKIECRGCCSELSKKGTIIFRNFFVEADGSIAITNSSSVSIKNDKCQQGVLDAFRKNCRFSPPKYGRYEYKSYSYSY